MNKYTVILLAGFILGGGYLLHDSDNIVSPSEEIKYKTDYYSPIGYERVDDPEQTRSYDDYGDYDCSDFGSVSEAQQFFEDEGGPYDDYHNLDRDGDGLACESL